MQQIDVQPLAVGLPLRVIFLALLVGDDALLLRVHKENPPRLQPALLHDMLRRDVEHAHLRGQNQPVVVRDVIPGRAQSVAVEGRPDHISVGEQNRRRAVPRLHHRRVVMVEILPFLVHERVMLPWLRNRHHHGERQIHAVHVQELERVVQHRGIRACFLNDRVDFVEILLHDRRIHGLLAGKHTVDIAADGIDFAVVRDHPVRVRAVPGRRGVGREAGVHDGDRSPVRLALQILIEAPQLAYQEHSLVDHGAGGQRTDIGVLRALLEFAADDIQSAVELNSLLHVLWPSDEALADAGHAVPCRRTENIRIGRNLPPSEEGQALLFRDDLQHPHGKGPLQSVLRQEAHSDAVISLAERLRILNAGILHRPRKEAVTDLQQNADAVAHAAGCILSCPVFQLFHNMQGIVQHPVILMPVDVDDDADAAGIMFSDQWSCHVFILYSTETESPCGGNREAPGPRLNFPFVNISSGPAGPLYYRRENSSSPYVGYGRYASGISASAASTWPRSSSMSARMVS